MRKLLAVLALLVGGLSVEAVSPLQCTLIANSQPRRVKKPGE
jgi:hypothetical protein